MGKLNDGLGMAGNLALSSGYAFDLLNDDGNGFDELSVMGRQNLNARQVSVQKQTKGGGAMRTSPQVYDAQPIYNLPTTGNGGTNVVVSVLRTSANIPFPLPFVVGAPGLALSKYQQQIARLNAEQGNPSNLIFTRLDTPWNSGTVASGNKYVFTYSYDPGSGAVTDTLEITALAPVNYPTWVNGMQTRDYATGTMRLTIPVANVTAQTQYSISYVQSTNLGKILDGDAISVVSQVSPFQNQLGIIDFNFGKSLGDLSGFASLITPVSGIVVTYNVQILAVDLNRL